MLALYHAHNDELIARTPSTYKLFCYLTLNIEINHNHYVVINADDPMNARSVHAAQWKRETIALTYMRHPRS